LAVLALVITGGAGATPPPLAIKQAIVPTISSDDAPVGVTVELIEPAVFST